MERYKIWKATRKRDVEKDAANRVNLSVPRRNEAFGPKPVFTPDSNREHAAIRAAFECDERIAVQLAAAEKTAATLHSHPWWPAHAVVCLIAVGTEIVTAVALFRSAGVGAPERVLFGVGLALGVLYLARVTMRLAQPVQVTK